MNSRLTELVGITLLGAAERLLKWNRSGRVTWRHITENGKAENKTEDYLRSVSQKTKEEDFEKFIKALSDNDFQGTFIICIVNGSAMVGWNINEETRIEKVNRLDLNL